MLELAQTIESLDGSADEDTDKLFTTCLDLLRSWKHDVKPDQDYVTDILGSDTQHIHAAVLAVEHWIRQHVQKLSSSKREAWISSLEQLEDVADGKPGGGSWKEKLEGEAAKVSWDDVQREASYYLVGDSGTPLHKSLDILFAKLNQCRRDVELMYSDLEQAHLSSHSVGTAPSCADALVGLKDLVERTEKTTRRAEITHTESFFYEVLTSSDQDKGRKLKKRFESMSNRNITSDDIQQAIWRKVILVSSSRTRPGEPATPVGNKKPLR
jgi:hypothetical protein